MDIINDFIEIYRRRTEERRRRSEERRIWREHENNLKRGERRERRMQLMEKILDYTPSIGLFLLCYLFAHFTGLLVLFVEFGLVAFYIGIALLAVAVVTNIEASMRRVRHYSNSAMDHLPLLIVLAVFLIFLLLSGLFTLVWEFLGFVYLYGPELSIFLLAVLIAIFFINF
jgi:hypothetical protein